MVGWGNEIMPRVLINNANRANITVPKANFEAHFFSKSTYVTESSVEYRAMGIPYSCSKLHSQKT